MAGYYMKSSTGRKRVEDEKATYWDIFKYGVIVLSTLTLTNFKSQILFLGRSAGNISITIYISIFYVVAIFTGQESFPWRISFSKCDQIRSFGQIYRRNP